MRLIDADALLENLGANTVGLDLAYNSDYEELVNYIKSQPTLGYAPVLKAKDAISASIIKEAVERAKNSNLNVVLPENVRDGLVLLRGQTEGFGGNSLIEDRHYPKWISAKDKLPKHEENVLLYFGKFMGVGYYDEADQSFYDAADDYELVNVTHWMPLPEPPKEEEG